MGSSIFQTPEYLELKEQVWHSQQHYCMDCAQYLSNIEWAHIIVKDIKLIHMTRVDEVKLYCSDCYFETLREIKANNLRKKNEDEAIQKHKTQQYNKYKGKKKAPNIYPTVPPSTPDLIDDYPF